MANTATEAANTLAELVYSRMTHQSKRRTSLENVQDVINVMFNTGMTINRANVEHVTLQGSTIVNEECALFV